MNRIILVKKIKLDGTLCKKCIDVDKKIIKDKLQSYISKTIFINESESESEGHILANKFNIITAPFFIVNNEIAFKTYFQFKNYLENKTTQNFTQDDINDIL